MEIFGGFMVMMSIVSLFLAVVWLVMPFVVFAVKGKIDRALVILEGLEKRMATMEAALAAQYPGLQPVSVQTESPPPLQHSDIPDSGGDVPHSPPQPQTAHAE